MSTNEIEWQSPDVPVCPKCKSRTYVERAGSFFCARKACGRKINDEWGTHGEEATRDGEPVQPVPRTD